MGELIERYLLFHLDSLDRARTEGMLENIFDDIGYIPEHVLEEGLLFAVQLMLDVLHEEGKLGRGGLKGFRGWTQLTRWAMEHLQAHRIDYDCDFGYWIDEYQIMPYELNTVLSVASELVILGADEFARWDVKKISLEADYGEVTVTVRRRIGWL